MDKDEARELNREAKIDKYESDTDKQCRSIWLTLDSHNIESDSLEQFEIISLLEKHGVDLDIVDLGDCESVEDVLDALDW